MYNHAPEDYICPFCLVAQGIENEHVYTRQTDVVYRNNAVTAAISSHQRPNNRGLVVIFPNQHFENIYDLPVHLAAKIHELARSVAMAMKAAYACEGISTMQHNEPAGNQDVWHYHLHLFPRYADDGLYSSRRELMAVNERAEYAQRLRAKLGDGQSSGMDELD